MSTPAECLKTQTAPDASAVSTAFPTSMSSSEAFPVKTSPSLAEVKDSRVRARVFGPSLLGSFASYDPATSSLRMLQLSLLEAEPEFLKTLPRAGLMRSGTVYRLAPLAPLTKETASGSWPTPDASVANLGEGPETWYARREELKAKGINGNGAGVPLSIAAQVGEDYRERVPTPTAQDAEQSGGRNKTASQPDSRTHSGTSLTDYVREDRMLPTPTAQDAKNDAGPSQWQRKSLPLNVVAKLLPTPTTSDGKGGPGNGGREGGENLRTAVARLEKELLPTPTAADGERGSETYMRGNPTLLGAARESLPTPNARDWKGAPGSQGRERGGRQASLPATTKEQEGSGALNPTWVEALMGFPTDWTKLED